MDDFTATFTADKPSLLAFRWRLAEAIAWAERHTPPKPEQIAWVRQPENLPDVSWGYHALRSPLREAAQGIDLEQVHLSTIPTEKEYQLVEAVVRARADLLRAENRYPADAASDLNSGELIAYYPTVGFNDGTPAFTSDGFFDVSDAPPFETWLGLIPAEEGRQFTEEGLMLGDGRHKDRQWSKAYDESYLIAYVPLMLVPQASEGISVNFIDGINWLHNLDTPFTRLLFAAKILAPAWLGSSNSKP